jgi:molybdate transport system ATP-binding protein
VLICLKNVSLELNHRRLLSSIWLEIQKNDVLCIVGANGSGKSTLLKLLAGQHWQTSGKRLYHFITPPRASPIGASIALVSPETQERYQRMQHDRTALEVLSTGFAQTDFLYTPLEPEQQQTLLELAQSLHLELLLKQPFFTLSKGQMRQVLLARAMLAQPQVLLLDEFFSGVDIQARLRLRQIVQHFLTQGGTLVYTTHRAEPAFVQHERVFNLMDGVLHAASSHSSHQPHSLMELEVAPLTNKIKGEINQPLIEIHNSNVYLWQLEDNATAPDGHQANSPQLILKDIHFSLFEQQHWLITGHNGAGKSTFAKVLRGDLSPAFGGTVRWFGHENLPIWERHAQIALVSSDLQHIHRVNATGFEIIASGYFGGVGWHGGLEPQQHSRVLELANALNIAHLLEQNTLYTSQGELRKLLLARALVTAPKVIILDEAFDYLDATSRELVWRMLLKQNATLVVIAHREEDQPPFATRHLELQHGKIA